MTKKRFWELSGKGIDGKTNDGSGSKIITSWITEIWKTFNDERVFTDHYEESFESLFTPRELDIDRDLFYKIQDIKNLFKDLKLKYKEWAFKDNLEFNKAVEDKILSCFWILQDEYFDLEKYNQKNGYLAFQPLLRQLRDFKTKFCTFLKVQSQEKEISKQDLVEDTQGIANEFFNIFEVRDEHKPSYKAAICMVCMSISYFGLGFCDPDK